MCIGCQSTASINSTVRATVCTTVTVRQIFTVFENESAEQANQLRTFEVNAKEDSRRKAELPIEIYSVSTTYVRVCIIFDSECTR